MILVDTNVLVAAASPDDNNHAAAANLLLTVTGPLLVTPTVVAETCYMLSTWTGQASEVAFLRSFGGSDGLRLTTLTEQDLSRMADLTEQYADLRLGGTDASIIATAERLGIERVATFNHRDFAVVVPNHVSALTLLP